MTIEPTRGGGRPCPNQQRAYRASRRMPPLAPCGCIRHPGVDRHRCNSDEVTEAQAWAAVAAAEHLNMLGTPGVFDRTSCEAMLKTGNKELAIEAFRYAHGEAA